MSNKHLATLFLLLGIIGCLQVALVLNRRMTQSQKANVDANDALARTQQAYTVKRIQLETLRQDSAPVRAYLSSWMPKLRETDEETKARAMINRITKQSEEGLITRKNQGAMEALPNQKFIPQRFRTVLAMEGDYISVMNLISNLERQMPASRVSSLNISKGTKGNDVRFNLTLDTPVIQSQEKKTTN